MSVANLTNEPQEVISGNDNIVIVDYFQSIRGGRTLDTAGFKPEVIKAGHVIIKDNNGNHKPMQVSDDNAISAFGTIVGGTGYTTGTYNNVALSGGSGSGATANIVVASGVVTTVTKVSSGSGYNAGDTLTASIPGGSGFSVQVSTVASSAYVALPENHVYAGILIASILTKKPFAGILVRGTVNLAAAPYPMTSILSAVKAALPLIDFRED
ncbi:MAG: hypothetical protein LBS01_01050 [Prevotellaceae bacterium]|jgi:hypothetical protein|nr:hypothetical protein [Prevotellaceae bacterium]